VETPEFTREILLTLGVTAAALALFIWNRFSVDVVGAAVMVALILLGLVSPQQGISGFANEATITVAAMFVLSTGLVRTGAIDIAGRWIARRAGGSELRLLIVALAIVVPLSAFINNTPVVVVMIPVLLGIARDSGAAPSRLLMPVSFASQLGGTLTLIGTSTNLVVAGLVLDLGLDRIGLFQITPPALVHYRRPDLPADDRPMVDAGPRFAARPARDVRAARVPDRPRHRKGLAAARPNTARKPIRRGLRPRCDWH
jgi:hypothetical protein